MMGGPPPPPVRSKISPGKFSGNGVDHHQLHAVERTNGDGPDNGLEHGKWEYMGFGIWENKDGEENDGVGGHQVASKDIHVTSTTRTTMTR